MKLDQLRRMALFAIVAREGSFTAVAQQQNIATSAISSAVTQLESELGIRLLHRSTRQLRLTDAGALFLKRCEAMLFEANSAHEEISQMSGQLAGQLTITASNLEAQSLVLPALAPLLQAHPKLILNLRVDDHQMDLVAHGVDMAIRAGRLEDSSLIARPLTLLPEVLVAAPSYLAQYGSAETTADLARHRIIAFEPFAHPSQLTLVDQQGVQQTVQLSIGAKTDSVEVVRQLAILGMGIARLPRTAVAEALQRGQLVQVMAAYRLPAIQIYAVTIKRDLQPPKVLAAIEHIQRFIQSSAEW